MEIYHELFAEAILVEILNQYLEATRIYSKFLKGPKTLQIMEFIVKLNFTNHCKRYSYEFKSYLYSHCFM